MEIIKERYYLRLPLLVRHCQLSVCSCHVMYTFQSESTLYSCLNVKELLARNRRDIWSLSDCNWTQTHDHLVHKWTLNHLAKLTMGGFESSCSHLNCPLCLLSNKIAWFSDEWYIWEKLISVLVFYALSKSSREKTTTFDWVWPVKLVI